MKTKKELSLNTQLTKLREVISLLKQTAPVASNLDISFGGNRGYKIQQFIYSLRDLQYRLRGLNIKVSRSAQTRRMSVSEIYDSILDCGTRDDASIPHNIIQESYDANLQKAQALLGTVVTYCELNESNTEANDRVVVESYMQKLSAYNFPRLTKNQIDLLRDKLMQELESQSVENDELF